MPGPNEELIKSQVASSLDENIKTVKNIMQASINKDFNAREFMAGSVRACAMFLEGMAGNDYINDFILRPAFDCDMPDDSQARVKYLSEKVISINQADIANEMSEIAKQIISGLTVVFVDGCAEALILDTRDYAKRAVGKTVTESVVLGSQEGFVENLRTNITLMRRYVRSTMLVTEPHSLGSKIQTNCAIIYLNGVANEKVINNIRRRVLSIDKSEISSSGQLMQLIEERPFFLFPQVLQTERPDRAAAAVMCGQIVILVDNSPYAIVLPTTVFDLLHASDDAFMRWQYASFVRLIRMLGVLLSLYLPGIYLALTLYHSHMLPMDLLTSIAETRANVPFPIIVEILIMEFSFYLINEAGTRIPSQIGSALGIVGALILGQAAVSASIISPILIIIVALTGLGNYVVPNYSMNIAVEIARIFILFTGAIWGLYGIVLASLGMLAAMASVECFGVPYLSPVTPDRPHGPDLLMRLPVRLQKTVDFFAQRKNWMDGERK